MSILVNIKNFFVYFSIIFFVSFLFYLLKIIDIYNSLLNAESINYIYMLFMFFINYFFPLSILASILSVLFISTGVKLRGEISVVLSLLIISFIGVIYPVYIKYINYNAVSSFLFPQEIDLDTFSFKKQLIYNDGTRFIYIDALGMNDGYKYKNVLVLDNYKVINAKYANETKNNLNLVDVEIIDMNNNDNTKLYHDEYDIPINSDVENNTLLDLFFAVPLLKYFSAIFIFFTNTSTPFYIYIILYISLFFLLMGFYVLGGSLSVPGLKFHNIMLSFGIYILSILTLNTIFTLISEKISIYNLMYGLGVLQSSLIVLFISIAVNIFAFLLHYTLRFDKYYKN